MANVWWKFDLQLIRAGDEEELRRVRVGLGFRHDAVAGFKVSAQQLDWGIPDGEYDNELRFGTYLREMKESRMIAASKARKLEKSPPISKFEEIVAKSASEPLQKVEQEKKSKKRKLSKSSSS